MTNDETAIEIARLEKLVQRTEMHLSNRMDALEEIFNENPDRVNEGFDEVENRLKYLLDRINYTDKDLKDLRESSKNSWNALEEKDLITNTLMNEKTNGLEDQIFALGKFAENLEERMRRMEQNWALVKKHMQFIQYKINETLPDTEKLPPDWLDQCEVIRDIVNPQNTETEVKND